MRTIIRIAATIIGVAMATTLSVSAWAEDVPNLGELDYWYADNSIISHWNTTPKIYAESLSTNKDFDLNNYIGFGIYQWSNNSVVNCTLNGTSSSHTIHFYGGTAAQLEAAGVFSDCTGVNGKTKSTATVEGNYTYNGEIKTCKVTTYSKIALVEKSRTDMAYCKTSAHELGHAIGYSGHSLTKGDIMYTSSIYNTTNALTERDVKHIYQIYHR